MIILVKNQNRKRLLIKTIAVTSLFLMFFLYYNHMSQKFQDENFKLSTELNIKEKKEKKTTSKSVKIENLIFEEAKIIVKLLDQRYVKELKIVDDKLLIICDYTTDIEPLLVRYGANALVKNSDRDIKIAINLAIIVENKYES